MGAQTPTSIYVYPEKWKEFKTLAMTKEAKKANTKLNEMIDAEITKMEGADSVKAADASATRI